MFHTPAKKSGSSSANSPASPTAPIPSQVRRSIGEWEAGKQQPPTTTNILKQKTVLKTKKTSDPVTQSRGATPAETTFTRSPSKYPNRVAEAKACLMKAKFHLGNSRNTKTEIKEGVVAAVERLYRLVAESEEDRKRMRKDEEKEEEPNKEQTEEPKAPQPPLTAPIGEISHLLSTLAEHSRLVKESNVKIENLKLALDSQVEEFSRSSYASVAAGASTPQPVAPKALHSVVVTSKDEMDTGDQVLDKVRKAVDAKEGWVKVERVRKAKDQKVIIACGSTDEREKLKKKLQGTETLNVEDIKNKRPLVTLKNVFSYNTNEDILKALKNQNPDICRDVKLEEEFEIRYRRVTRNPHQCNISAKVSPRLWSRLTKAGQLRIDLQPSVIVVDQTPLVQCSLCLGYGHSRRFCTETTLKCCHCGGPHMRTECADWRAGASPTCSNCITAKLDRADHNAFSRDCPVRRKWDALARQTVAYC